MLSETEMQAFLIEVVAAEFPDEEEEFELGGKRVIKQAYADQLSPKPTDDPNKFRFIAEATVVLTFVKLVAATVVAVKQAWDAIKSLEAAKRKQALQEEWKTQLVAAGIATEKAAEIAGKFASQLDDRLRKSA